MKYLDLIKEKLSSLTLMWILIMFIAIWSVFIQDGQINRDGLLYLKQAYLFSEGNWNEGLVLYPWPFYSILIGIIHKITNLHLQLVAHGLNLVLFGLATFFYLKTLKFIYKQKNIIFFGGLILLSFTPLMDKYVGMVMRDHGLWAGCMMGTYFYFYFLSKKTLIYSLIWQLAFLFAGLFRPEAFVFLILIPLLHLFLQRHLQSNLKNIKIFIQQYLLVFVCIFYWFISKVLSFSFETNINHGNRLNEFYPRIIDFFEQAISPLPLTSNNKPLMDLLQSYPIAITFGLLISIVAVKWFKCAGFLMSGLLLYGFHERFDNNLESIKKRSLVFFITVSFFLVFMNLFNVYILTNRYWIFHFFWLFIFFTPFLSNFFNNSNFKNLSFAKPLVGVLIFTFILNSLIDNHEKNIDEEVGIYLKKVGIKDSLKLIGSDRAGYYGGLSIKDIIKSSDKSLINAKFIIYQGKLEGIGNFATDYKLVKTFSKKNHEIFIFKKIDDVK